MKAIQTKQYRSEGQLEMVEVPKPSAAAGQVVGRIAATSFNPIDPNRTSGNMRQVFPLQFPFTPGGDFSGALLIVGKQSSRLADCTVSPGIALPCATKAFGKHTKTQERP